MDLQRSGQKVARAGLKVLDKKSQTLFLTHAHTNLQRWCKFFHQYNTFSPKTPQVQTWGRKTRWRKTRKKTELRKLYQYAPVKHNRAAVNIALRNTPQRFSRWSLSYSFSRSTKHIQTSLAYFQDCENFCDMWSALLRPGRKPNWVSFRFGSIISRHLFQGTWKRKC